MNTMMNDLIVKYNDILSELKDSYRYQCSEISIKISALNLACTGYEIDIKKFKSDIEEFSSMSDLESRLIAFSLYLSVLKTNESKADIREMFSAMPSNSLKGVYSLICSLIIYCSDKNRMQIHEKFHSLSKTLSVNHPVNNSFEYSPFVLLSSLVDNSADEIERKARSLYYSLHDSGFARGTNAYCSTMYLSIIPYSINAKSIRSIYNSFKPLIPCNQYNYLDCAELYIYDNNFSDHQTIVDIYSRISNLCSYKWFSEQLDVSISVSIYLHSLKCTLLPGIYFLEDYNISSNLLTSMIASTLLLNSNL